MADIETRLRTAMRTEAEQAQPERLRQLRSPAAEDGWTRRLSVDELGPAGAGRSRRGERDGWRPGGPGPARRRAAVWGWLAPVAAAAAIVVAVALVYTGVHASGLAPSKLAASGSPAPVPVTGTASLTAMPSSYLEIDYGTPRRGSTIVPLTAVLRSSATGAVQNTLALPGLYERTDPLIAAGLPGEFVVAVPTKARGSQHEETRIMLVLAGNHGRSLHDMLLPALTGGDSKTVTGIALSADGTELALAVQSSPAPPGGQPATGSAQPTTGLQVTNLKTWQTRSWMTNRTTPDGAVGTVSDLSWGTGDRTLAFQWNASYGQVADRGLYLLDTARHDGLLGREAIPGMSSGGRSLGNAYLGQPGTVVADVAYPDPTKGEHLNWGYPAIVELSLRTGQVLRTLYPRPHRPGPLMYSVLAANPAGNHLLVSTQAMGRIGNGRFTRLPVPFNPNLTAAW